MKVGKIKVKRHYIIAQIILDLFSLVLMVLIGQATISLIVTLQDYAKYLAQETIVKEWLPALIWCGLAVVVMVISLWFTYKNRKYPSKYNIPKENIQKYYDIIITCVSAVRVLLLLAVFDMMYIHHSYILYKNVNFFSLQVLCDFLFAFIIIRFSMHRIKKIEVKKDTEKRRIIEN